MRPKKGVAQLRALCHSNINAMVRCNVWFLEVLSRDPRVQCCGVTVVQTFNGFTQWDNMTLARCAPISHHLAVFKYVAKCTALRLGAFLVMEEQVQIKIMWKLARPFTTPTIRDRCHLCGEDMRRVHALVSNVDLLPECLGGTVADEAAPDFVAEWIRKGGRL